jgi:hypothetical protein
MPSRVLYTNLNDFCRKYLVAGTPVSREESANFGKEKVRIESELFENLALFDQVDVLTYGENIPLALMMRTLGENGLYALVDQKAIRFTLWTPFVAKVVDRIDGIDPLVSGNTSSKAHADPEESIQLGLGWLDPKPDRSTRRRLARKFRDLYTIPDPKLAHEAIGLTKAAYASGRLDAFGFDHDATDFSGVSDVEKDRLLKCASDLLEYRYALNQGLDSYSKSEFFEFFTVSLDRIASASDHLAGFTRIAELERFPNLQELYTSLDGGFEKIIEARAKRSARKFRAWLATQPGGSDAADITREYVDAIANRKGMFDSVPAKLTKSVALASVGAGIGAAIAGMPGSAIGAAVLKAAEPAVDFALDLVDAVLIDGLTKGWSPRIFVDDLRKMRDR